MIFSSPKFILLFLPIAFLGYFYLNRIRLVLAGKAWLVAVSLFFYAYWNIAYLPLLVGSILFNFAIGTALAPNPDKPARFSRRLVLAFGIIGNLGLLGYFKYADFLIDNINAAFDIGVISPHLLLPLGISFFTFTQIAYLVDSYRGEAREYDFLNYALFVTFFPHLIAGPILHHGEMMSQFKSRWTLVMRYRNIALGLFIFSIGLFKKVVIADTFAVWANAGFEGGETLDFFSAWGTSLSYTFQLYFDFSGYCDMAIGAALLFNIWLPINFNSPYQALDIQDFWRRWHMTLSRYLRDYLYIPLGGNRCSTPRVYLNLMATFILGGLWHGASWMFVLWGAFHGAALVIHRAWSGFGLRMPRAMAWLLTFNFINLTWIFFRADTLESALRIIRGMADINSVFNLTALHVPTDSLVWGGWFSDYLLRWLPAGLAANILCFIAILLTLGIISRKNSFELMVGVNGQGTAKFSGALVLFCIAMYSTMVTTSSIFLYFNF
ncbi:D-alanyl-lipoteichoic acid acyltransferase DltB (MBOAT superfamily) [Nitrosospira sp. Nsp2]|uniref:MBOAT family O-acyltransferase n=1 Tax=Nitrosospira sp. Nsp2 TaxID=136548 RepID=UPI000D31F09B|nr:MBOAT family protein [Nitrosospira sp. Nsp2]PTR16117.1 D-alanyl-lipoteichoic acid acyltransferase DltB (MBOAT superfamily) [Nitrosospira sp. Nsp2]